jgi:hypothetical protein
MTSMLERPVQADAPARPRRTRADVVATRPVAAVTAAVWAAGVGLLLLGVVVSLAWAVSSRGDEGLTTPLRASGTLWLVAHHAPVSVGSATITLLPLLLLALPLLLLARAGRWAARITSTTTVPDVALVVLTGTATYAFVAFLVAQVSGIAEATLPQVPVIVWSTLVALVGLTVGAVQGAGLVRPLVARLPRLVRRGMVTAAASGSALVAMVGVVAVIAVVARWSTVTGLARGVAPGPWDMVGLFLLSLAYLPNLLVWTLAYVAGPGFAVGGAIGANPFAAGAGLLPGVPLLGAVPQDPPAAAPLLLLLPVLAGVVGAVVLRRRGPLGLLDEVLVDLGAAAAVGLAAGVLSLLASGSLGSARLAQLGPDGLVVGVAVFGLVAAGSLLWSLLAHALPTIWVREDAP